MLPEKWFIKVTKENKKELGEWRYCGSLSVWDGYCVSEHERQRGYYFKNYEHIPKQFLQEITIEEFRRYVTKTLPIEPELSFDI
jgi:hypothetical protein